MSANIEFKYINPELYRHPLERQARERMEKIPGFNKAMSMMQEGWSGRGERHIEIASMVRVGPGIYPALDILWNQTLTRFGLASIPLHIAFESPYPWAIQGGNEYPSVVLGSRWLELGETAMSALLATQAGAIRLGNATYLAAADYLRWVTDFSGVFGAPAALVSWGLETWRRYAAFSSDRAAALSLGAAEPVAELLNLLAGAGSSQWGGISEADHLRFQGLEASSYTSDWANSKWRRFTMAMNRQNNVSLIRRLDLTDWFGSDIPERIMTGQVTDPDQCGCGYASSTLSDSPGAAFWGEFAGMGNDDADASCPVQDIMGMAEKGLNSFMRAGEAFWNTLMDKKGR